MKLLIIEGPDRTGKDSLIAGLLPHCQNAIVTHFSTPIGETDLEKREYQEDSFHHEFIKANNFLKEEIFRAPKPGKLNLLIWNRAHLGEFVYGKLYRETNPEEWVMKLEEMHNFNNSDEIYLLLLTGDPKFLSSRDDGESFDSSVEARKKEINNFRNAFQLSNIKKKLELKIDHINHKDGKEYYRPVETIIQETLQFLNT